MSTERELRRRCRRLLAELDIQPPLDVVTLCHRLGQQRGKPIRLVAYRIPVPGPFGMWVRSSTTDYVLYQQETTKIHQDHIILHEIGHVLAGHGSDEGDDALMKELLEASSLPPDVIRRALRRTAYETEQEREAETVATIILEWASVVDSVAPKPSAGGAAQRMGTALNERLGWL